MEATDYVSYELAVKLKACGFDEPCDYFWTPSVYSQQYVVYSTLLPGDPSTNFNDISYNDERCSAPTLWHAQKWLREKKELCVTVCAQPYKGLPYYTGYILFEGDEKEVLDQDGHWFDDYEICLSETIAAALELIKEGE